MRRGARRAGPPLSCAATLVIVETALALMLLVGAGLLIKSFARLQDVNPGFSSGTSPDNADLAAGEPLRRRWRRGARSGSGCSRRRRAIPGVTAAGLTSNVPFNGNVSSGSYAIVGYTPGPSEAQPHGRQEVVGGDYFRAMQIPVLQGRTFTDGDTTDSPRVVVIDQYLANRYFAESQPARPGNPARPGAAGPLHHRRRRRHHQ